MNNLFKVQSTKYKVQSTKYKKQGTLKLFFATLISVGFSHTAQSQEAIKDTTQLEEVVVSSIRAKKKTPVTFSNLNKTDIESRNLGQDIPILMNFMPSVVTTSDAGNGFGYTGIRVRGSDATRVNVTINGIPYNDAESHGTFWVNMPDFASSVENLQLQRGVGTSTNGSGAFGASLNLLTDSYAAKAGGEIANSFGSFNSRKHTLKFSTGLLNDRFELAGRLSKINSDGYIDRAFSDLKSYFLQGVYKHKNTLLKALLFGGSEKTYQAWNGIDAGTLAVDRTYNPSGYYTDADGTVRFYDNETDNYQQDHAQLLWNEKWSNTISVNVALHYTKGKGYYENFKEDADFNAYGITPIAGESTTDLVRQKWLDNDFYGATASLHYKKGKTDLTIGSGFHSYEGSHFGKVVWARFASDLNPGDTYYDHYGNKREGNLFVKVSYSLSKKWLLFGDMQYRYVHYKANGDTGEVNDQFRFGNPKVGVTFSPNIQNTFYFSYARAHREPNRTDYENGNPKPEQLNDFELGWRYDHKNAKINLNGYAMLYKNQLILTGALDDVGNPIRENSGKSYRIGIEADVVVEPFKNLYFQPNITLSQNQNRDFYFSRDGQLQSLGNTEIAFSPSLIMGNRLTYRVSEALQMSLFTKYVGEQYMGNIDSENSKLAAYSTTDLNLSYTWQPKSLFSSIRFNVLLNNIFNKLYVNNGYFYTYDDTWTNPGTTQTIEGSGYYPQAGFNFLAGLTLAL